MTTNIANSTPLPYFNLAQTFFVDTSIAPQNSTIALTSVNVYFKYKPQSNNTLSGLALPGITLYLVPTIFNVPQITLESLQNSARCEWSAIATSSAADVATNFRFNQPVFVTPGKSYAIVLSFDGNETFEPWTAIIGQRIVGKTTQFTGPNIVGNYYEFVSSQQDTTNTPTNAVTEAQYLSFWNSVLNTQMTFDIFAARYSVNSVPVTVAGLPCTIPIFTGTVIESWDAGTNTVLLTYPSKPYEAISFDLSQSTVQSFIGAQRAFQNTITYPGGNSAVVNATAYGGTFVPISVTTGNTIITANNNLPNGVAFDWNAIYPSLTGTPFVTITSAGQYNVRMVVGIPNTTVIQVDEPVSFTNAAARFMVTPAGTVDSILQHSPYGVLQNVLFLGGSSANSKVRFVNNTIQTITASGGTGYNNSDVLYIQGFQNVAGKAVGGYPAIANIVTNGSGTITNIYPSNLGCGFVNSQNMFAAVSNSTPGNQLTNTSAGSGASFTYTVGATVITEQTNNIFQNCIVSNFNIDDITAFFKLDSPAGITYAITATTQYYMNVDSAVYGGLSWYVQNAPTSFPITLNKISSLVSNNPVAFVSWSNEFVTCFANGALNTFINASSQISNGIIIQVATHLNIPNDFIAINIPAPPTIEFGHFVVNNSWYNEYTNSGNAWAKHITSLINFNNSAEDLRVYLTVYKPINTDFRVYAKIQNANDPGFFSKEDWTELQLIAGQGLVSSSVDRSNYVELGYGFYPYPQMNTQSGAFQTTTLAGTISTTNNSSNVVGVNTSFISTANIANGAMVRIYAPLFPAADYIVATVNNAVSDTQLNLDTVFTSNVNIGGNPALIANGLAIDVIGYPHQTFNNINNDNVSRYWSQSTVKYDGFSLMQLKVVMLSNAYSYIPEIHDIRLLGVSA
jgi:hypothetical protein